MVSLPSFVIIGFFLFLIGLMVVLYRRHLIAIFLGIELMLNGSALTFVAYSRFLTNQIDGHIFSLFIILVAAAEAAVSLAIAVRFWHQRNTIHIDDASLLKN